MSDETAMILGQRINEYARESKLDQVFIVLHGGEPLLSKHSGLRCYCDIFKSTIEPQTQVVLAVETNGTLLDEAFIRLARDYKMQFGLSMDGPPTMHDRTRPYHNMNGSGVEVERALKLLVANEDVFGGVLCVSNFDHDPHHIYQCFVGQGVKRLDFLLPDTHLGELTEDDQSQAALRRHY